MTEPRNTPNPATTTRPGRSSAKAGGAGGNKLLGILLGLLLLLVLIGLLLYFLLRGSNDDGSTVTPAVSPSVSASQAPTPSDTLSPSTAPTANSSAPTTTPSASTSATALSATIPATPPAPGSAGGAATGTLMSGTQDVIAAAGSNTLAPLVGKPVTGTAVVQEVVADEGFWVGSSPEQRTFVYLTKAARGGGGESGPKVKAGDTVTLTGTVGALADNAPAAAGVTTAEGKAQLTRQGALVLATTYALS